MSSSTVWLKTRYVDTIRTIDRRTMRARTRRRTWPLYVFEVKSIQFRFRSAAYNLQEKTMRRLLITLLLLLTAFAAKAADPDIAAIDHFAKRTLREFPDIPSFGVAVIKDG